MTHTHILAFLCLTIHNEKVADDLAHDTGGIECCQRAHNNERHVCV